MSGKENLSLDEFATAPRKPQSKPDTLVKTDTGIPGARSETGNAREPDSEASGKKGKISTEASKALRQMKRVRMKGANHFVNVNLDRDTKRRLKLAAFNLETSMQAIMEKAIRQYLGTNGF